MRNLIVISIMLSIALSSFAQKHRNSGLYFETHATQGIVLQSNDFVRGDNREETPINDFSATDLRIGWQTTGDKAWHHAHNLPYYGIGIHSIVFSNEDEIGYPAALYFFFGAPFARKGKSSFDYEFSFGLSHNWKPYDVADNPFNVAIGSYRNAYIDGKIKYVRYLSKRVSLDAGVRVTHFSNGAMRFPNAGINLFAPFVGLRYNLIVKDVTPRDQLKIQKVEQKDELNIILASGKRSVKHTSTINEHMVSLVNISLEYLKPAGSKFKYGMGIDLGIDQNRNLTVDGDYVELASKKKQFFSAVSVIGQFRANRLAVQAGIGYELFNNNRLYLSNDISQRLGLRFYVHKNAFAGIAIKAKGFNTADYIEWSIGYSM